MRISILTVIRYFLFIFLQKRGEERSREKGEWRGGRRREGRGEGGERRDTNNLSIGNDWSGFHGTKISHFGCRVHFAYVSTLEKIGRG